MLISNYLDTVLIFLQGVINLFVTTELLALIVLTMVLVILGAIVHLSTYKH